MTVEDKSVFKELYAFLYRKADEEKAAYYERLMKLPNNAPAVEIAKIERHILECDKFQSFLHYRGMNKKIPYKQRKAYAEAFKRYDAIIGRAY